MTKGFSVLMYSANPPLYFVCTPTDQRVLESHTVITKDMWTAPDINDQNKRKTYLIGESRSKSNTIKKPMVIMVFERRLTAHVKELVRVMQL
jgi:hypothetical protein